MSEIVVTREEIEYQMAILDTRKSHSPDGIANWVLKECKEELVDKV